MKARAVDWLECDVLEREHGLLLDEQLLISVQVARFNIAKCEAGLRGGGGADGCEWMMDLKYGGAKWRRPGAGQNKDRLQDCKRKSWCGGLGLHGHLNSSQSSMTTTQDLLVRA